MPIDGGLRDKLEPGTTILVAKRLRRGLVKPASAPAAARSGRPLPTGRFRCARYSLRPGWARRSGRPTSPCGRGPTMRRTGCAVEGDIRPGRGRVLPRLTVLAPALSR